MRHQRAFADAGVLERDEPGLRIAALRDGVGVGAAELQVGGGERQRDDDGHPCAGRQPAAARDGLGPARPGAAGLVVGAAVRPVEPLPELRQHDRQQRQRDERRDEWDQHPAVAHRAQERQRQCDQREQADRDRDAAEQDGSARRLHRALHGLVARASVCALLAPARDDDQRVVDRHAEPDQRDQELHDRRDGRQLGQPEQQQERRQDRDQRHHQRHDGEERGEHERQHDERTEAAEHRLDEHAGALALGAAVLRERVEARQEHALAADAGVAQRGAGGLLGGHVLTEGGVRVGSWIDERERRAAVLGDEGLVARRGVGRDPRAGKRSLEAGVEPLQIRLYGRRVNRLAGGKGDDGKQRRRVSTARPAVALGDRDVRLPALLVGDRELRLQRVGRRACRGHAGDGERQPRDDDDALVGEDPTGER